MKNFKEIVKQEGTILGTWISLTDPSVVEFVKWSGFDFVCLDNEYFPFEMNMMAQMIRTANNMDIPMLIRVSRMEDISMLVSTGAFGIMIPDCNYERAKEAVERIKYAPIGNRSMFAGSRAMRTLGFDFKQYYKQANDYVSLFIQIESKEGMDDLDKILALEGVDFVCTGRNDISQSLGVAPDANNQKVLDFEDIVVKKTIKAGKIPFLGAQDEQEACEILAEQDVRILIVSRDIPLLMSGFSMLVKKLK
jgi:2-keto-3-deoxy-L-rhamnonate aldolase RhmA